MSDRPVTYEELVDSAHRKTFPESGIPRPEVPLDPDEVAAVEFLADLEPWAVMAARVRRNRPRPLGGGP